jgi:hypothetical protein
VSRVTTITGPLAALVAHAGGVAELAAALGVSEMTLWRWGTGKAAPRGLAASAVNDWAKRRRLPTPF